MQIVPRSIEGDMRHCIFLFAWFLLQHTPAALIPGRGVTTAYSFVTISPQSLGTNKIGSAVSSFKSKRPRASLDTRSRQPSRGDGFAGRTATMQGGLVEEGSGNSAATAADERKKVVVIGAGWAGLAATYELSKQARCLRRVCA